MDKKLPDCLINKLVDNLTEYEKVEYVEQAFSDSTHHLWRLQKSHGDQKNHFLKVCSNTESPFWRIMGDLFDFELRNEITHFSETYAFIGQTCSLEVPELIKAQKCGSDNSSHNAFILTSELKGSAVSSNEKSSNKSNQLVQQLAKHIAELHAKPINTWGSLSVPSFNSSDWSIRLQDILANYTKKRGVVISDSNLSAQSAVFMKRTFDKVLDGISKIKPTQFVPMMPDLRWDQFLQVDSVITALVDLDAFVYAPRELDFVILEYLLLPEQLSLFSEEYSKFHTIPDIKAERNAYRLLLFYMQILGEEDLDTWMNKETLF